MPLSDEHPIGAIVTGAIAGVLIIVNGGFDALAGAIVSQSAATAGFGGDLTALGGLAILLGLVMLGMVIFLAFAPESHVGIGIGLLIVGSIAIISGGGFVLGTILGVVSGILSIIYPYDEGAEPMPAFGPVGTYAAPPRTYCPSCGMPRGPSELRSVSANGGAGMG